VRTETETGTRRSRQTERNMNARSWEAMQTVNKIEMESVVLRACVRVCVCIRVCNWRVRYIPESQCAYADK